MKSATTDMGASLSPIVNGLLQHANSVAHKVHLAKMAKEAISVFNREITESRKHGRIVP